MAFTTPASAPTPDHVDEVLLAVELELMRAPAVARLTGARRRDLPAHPGSTP